MALITRCPECATQFKIVPDQLRISEGWVRCGHCNEVFDASADLHQQPTETLVTGPLSAREAAAPAAPVAPENAWTDQVLSVESALPASEALHLEFPEPSQFLAAHSTEGDDDGPNRQPVVEGGHSGDALLDADADAALEAELARELAALTDAALQEDEQNAEGQTPAHGASEAAMFAASNAVGDAPADDPQVGRQDDFSDESAGSPPGEASQTSQEASEDDAMAHAVVSDDDAPVEPSVPDMPATAEDAVYVAPLLSTAANTAVADAFAESSTEAISKADSKADPESASDDDASSAAMSTAAVGAAVGVAAVATSASAGESTEHYTFMRDGRARQGIWHKPAVRYALVFGVLVLSLALLLQWALLQREWLAARWPQSRPTLEALCAPLGCTVPTLRNIDAIAIDSSSFSSIRRGAYRLNVVLKNRGAYALAVPTIELALTDSQERPVIRKVIPPAELGVRAAAIEPRGELVASVELAVADDEAASHIVGYRLLAFYP